MYVFFSHFCHNYHHNYHCNLHYQHQIFLVIRAKRRFWSKKKEDQVARIGVRGQCPKENVFSVDVFPYEDTYQYFPLIHIFFGLFVFSTDGNLTCCKLFFKHVRLFSPSISRHLAPLWTASGEEYWSKPDFSAHWITLNYLPVFCTLSDNLFNACTLSQDDAFWFQAFLSIFYSRILFSVVPMVCKQEGSSACSIYPSRSEQAQFVSMQYTDVYLSL